MSRKIKPITPEQAMKIKADHLPEEVIKVFNDLIIKSISNGVSVIKQDDAVRNIMDVLDITRSDVFDRNLLDIEPLYENAGWIVWHDSPSYSESYPSTFTFTEKR